MKTDGTPREAVRQMHRYELDRIQSTLRDYGPGTDVAMRLALRKLTSVVGYLMSELDRIEGGRR
jgi:hypothetical protein